MKSKRWLYTILLAAAVLLSSVTAYAQGKTRETIQKAMKDELGRNMSNLALGELKRPCFISYFVTDGKAMSISASLGSIISSEVKPYRGQDVRVMAGDYKLNNENFMDPSSGFREYSGLMAGQNMPLEDDYYGIRRALWIATDNLYKQAAESYESKVSAIKQQNLSPETAIEDFSKAPKVSKAIAARTFDLSKEKWESAAKEISALFKDYKDIFSSNVNINFYQADAYFTNSEGTETVYPLTLASVQVTAATQANDGEPLYDHVLYYELTPNDLPSLDAMKKDVKAMADNLVALRKAPVFEDNYSGPIMFEGQAAAEMLSQRLFGGNDGLTGKRKQIYGDPKMVMFMSMMEGEPLDDKIDKKFLSDAITIKATPKTNKFNGKNLIGSYEVDAEGVVPPDELVLIDKGILKNLLNGRIPTSKIKESNGHERLKFMGENISSDIGPGVINISSSKGGSYDELKKQLIDKAKEEGLDYAIIVRKLQSASSGIEERLDPSAMVSFASSMENKGTVSRPIGIYKVSVKDGKEEMVRTATLGGISANSLKKISGATKDQFAYNTMLMPKSGMGGIIGFAITLVGGSEGPKVNGIPSSFIVPNAVIVDELEVKKEKRPITSKLPVVENPVGMK